MVAWKGTGGYRRLGGLVMWLSSKVGESVMVGPITTTIYGHVTSAHAYIPFSVISTSLATLRSLLRSRIHNAILFMLVCASVQCWMSMHPSREYLTEMHYGTNTG